MSKHRHRRERRERYYNYLDTQLPHESAFVKRIICTLDRGGIDVTTFDGKAIKANFRRYIEARRKSDPMVAMAGIDLLERAVRRISVDPRRRSTNRRDSVDEDLKPHT